MAPYLKCLCFVFFCATMAGCTSADEGGPPKKTVADKLFFDYNITAEEGRDEVTLKLEFRQSRRGKGVPLAGEAKVELDGEQLNADSTRYAGSFYEVSKPLEGFEGQHLISFTGSDGRKVVDTFEFRPFGLVQELPASMYRKPFSIPLSGLSADVRSLQLVIVDTSFESPDVNEDVPLRDGRVVVTQGMLDRLSNGPLILEIHSETSREVNQERGRGGRITIFYSLKREFELTSPPD